MPMRHAGLLTALLMAAASTAHAQFGPKTRSDRPQFDEPGRSHCSGVNAESQIVLRWGEGEADGQRRVDFGITVSVANPCPEPLEVRFGSFARYQTNFASPATAPAEPAGCLGQPWSFAGSVPPHQRTPFTLHVERCAVSSTGEAPRVTLESGRINTPSGEIPIPALTRTLQ